MKNILFVSHDASRTGAPIVLGHLMRWLKDERGADFSVLLKKGGELEDEFKELADIHTWSPGSAYDTLRGKIWAKLSYKLFNKVLYKKYPRQLKNKKFDLIYLNTVATTDVLPELKAQHNCPVILHVHESEFGIKANYADSLKPEYLKLVDHYIAVSESVRQNLVENFGIDEEKISLVNAFVPLKDIAPVTITADQIRLALRINDEFIVGAGGSASWRKGTDIFVQLALLVCSKLKGKAKFIWVGEVGHMFKCQLDYELKRIGLSGQDIIFTGSVKNPLDYFRVFDVFVLPSREDPFPLVCLEAASLGKPVICFDKAGGMAEFVNAGGGMVVPYNDVAGMAEAITSLYNNRDKVHELGMAAKNNVRQYDVAVQAPAILHIINAQTSGK